MTSPGRVTLAFFVAPLATPFVLWLGELILDYPGHVPSGLSGSLMVNLVFALPVAYLAELTLGTPAWKIYRHFGVSSPLAFAAGGAVIGAIPAVFVAGNPTVAGAICALAGAASALCFRALVTVRTT